MQYVRMVRNTMDSALEQDEDRAGGRTDGGELSRLSMALYESGPDVCRDGIIDSRWL
jgi:hypothetical protein